MNNSEHFSKNLPKWPAFIMVGDDVTVEQAKEIIFRTDHFLTDLHGYTGGNNTKFNDWYKEGLTSCITDYESNDYVKVNEYQQKLRQAVNFVDLNYVNNRWASCCYIGGPHGFCSPTGKIYYNHNVGKWPSVEEVYHDLEAIATAFPFISAKASLYDGETCEDDINLVVSFAISNGKVEISDTDFNLRAENPPPEIDLSNLFDSNREIGLPLSWYSYYKQQCQKVFA